MLLHSGPPIDVGARLRPAAPRAGRRLPVRGLGGRPRRRPRRCSTAARCALRERQRARPRRADDRRLLAVDAGLGRGGRGVGRARVLDAQRGAGAHAVVRRRRRRGGRAAALPARPRRAAAGARCSSAPGPIDVLGLAAQGLHMGDELHMRSQADGQPALAPAAAGLRGRGRRGRRRRSRRQPPLLPQPRRWPRRSARRWRPTGTPGSTLVHADVAQRHRHGAPGRRAAGPLVHGAGRAGPGRAAARGLSPTRTPRSTSATRR